MSYFVYMILCGDGSFYTGSTDDVHRRFAKHVAGKGASYTRSHKPIKVVYTEEVEDKSKALRREAVLKKLTHSQKSALSLI